MNENRTWKDVVADALAALGGEAHLKEITDLARKDEKAASNSRVDEKVRQVVRNYKIFEPVPGSSGRYRLLMMPSLTASLGTATTSQVTDEIQGKLLYIGRANDYETFAPADDCTKRQFCGQPLASLVSVRDNLADIPRLNDDERRTMARIDVIWFAERAGELRPCFAFEVENSTEVVTGLQRLSVIPELFQTRLFIVGESDSKKKKYEEFVSSPAYRVRAEHFSFRYFEQVRGLYASAESYAVARAAHRQMMHDLNMAG